MNQYPGAAVGLGDPIDRPDDHTFIKAAKRAYSRIGFSVVMLLGTFSVAGNAFYFLMYFILRDEEETARLLGIASSPLLGLVGIPLFFLVSGCRFSDLTPKVKRSIPIWALIMIFAACCACMSIGALAGQGVTDLLDLALGIKDSEGIVDSSIGNQSYFEILIFTALCPGIVEEIIFRKIIIDKCRRFGGFAAILISALCFSLFHGNFEQFFYVFLTGFVLASVYVYSGRIIYTIILHTLINMFGALVPSILEGNEALLNVFMIVNYVISFVGLVIIVVFIVLNGFERITEGEERRIEPSDAPKKVLLNPGMIVFTIVSAFIFIRTALLPIIQRLYDIIMGAIT